MPKQEQQQMPSEQDVNVPAYAGFGEDEQKHIRFGV